VSGTVAILRPGSTKFKDFPAGAPDLDKIQRAIGDALEKSRLITNDSRICHWNIRKVWAIGVPGMDIEVRQIES
jgi:Holliday junction resolvase RusA-like endonuclease